MQRRGINWDVTSAQMEGYDFDRLCTLTVTRLEIVRCIEVGLGRVVLAVSMKTPHRFLRSNEIRLPPSGVLDIPLQLTFALQVVE